MITRRISKAFQIRHVADMLRRTFDVERIQQMAISRLEQIGKNADWGTCDAQQIAEALAAIRALPLDRSEYLAVTRRLKNALGYFQGQHGLQARAELKLAEGLIHNIRK